MSKKKKKKVDNNKKNTGDIDVAQIEFEKETKKKAKSSLVWKFLERFIAQGIAFVIGIILARLLTPEDYGTIALTTIFITIANVFITSGFSNSLIQKKDADETDYSTMFYCSLVISILCYVIIYFLAPIIASFYNIEILKDLLRWLALSLPLSSIYSIQSAYVARNLIFKKFFFTTLIGTLVSGTVGVIMAFNGAGPWALVAQTLTSSVVNTLVLLFIVPWRPKLLFSKNSAKELMKYGYKLTLGALLSNTFIEIRTFVIGKIYNSDGLAFYNKGNHIPDLVSKNIDNTISSVIFPTLSNFSDNTDKIKEITRKTLRISSYVTFPIMMGLFAVARPVVLILLTEKWEPSIIFMQLQCLTLIPAPITNANSQAIKACGRSDIFLKMEVIKKSICILLLILVMNKGMITIAISYAIYSYLALFINMFPNKKFLKYSYKEQFKDIFKYLICSVVMGLLCYFITFLNLSNILTLVIQVALGVTFYIGLSILFKFEEFIYIKNIVISVIKKRSIKI